MVKLKLNTKTVINTDNITYNKSILNSLGVNCYLQELKCTKFGFCIIILKFSICVCVGEDSFAKGNYYQGAEINCLL